MRRYPLAHRLPFSVPRIDDEWLPSVLARCAEYAGLSRLQLLRHLHLGDLPAVERRNLGTGVADDVAVNLALGFGWEVEQVKAATMSRFNGGAILLRDPLHIAVGPLWARGSGTRYCADCLAEQPGVMRCRWRLAWTTVCTRHRVLLLDGCRACQKPLVEPQCDSDQRYDPTRCQNRVDEGRLCAHPLAEGWDAENVDSHSPIWEAALAIDQAVDAGRSRRTFDTLRGIGNALLRANALPLIADLADIAEADFRAVYDRPVKIGKAGPADALPMAAVTAAAWRLWTDPEPKMRPLIRRVTFATPVTHTPRQATYGPGGPEHLLQIWDIQDRVMERRILHALDSDLSPAQRVLWATPARAEVEEALATATFAVRHPENPEPSFGAPRTVGTGRSVPRHLWPNWVCPLDVGTRSNAVTLERTFALVTRFAGTRNFMEFGPPDEYESLAGRLRHTMLGDDFQTEGILRQLCELGLFLSASPSPIDYESRLRFRWDDLLHPAHWALLADAVGTSVGGRRRIQQVRRYMFMRITGAGAADLPKTWQFDTSTDDVANYTQFITVMTTGFQSAIDEYLTAYLRSHGDTGPVRWQPARWAPPGDSLGRELIDIDVGTMHQLLADGVTAISAIADVLQRSDRHVRWALTDFPRQSSPVDHVDWASMLDDWTLTRDQRLNRQAIPIAVDFGPAQL